MKKLQQHIDELRNTIKLIEKEISDAAASVALMSVQGAPADFQKTNALDAQQLNAQFATFKASDSCTGE